MLERKRTDRASRMVSAEPGKVYAALLDPGQLASWLPPRGATARIERFEPREGGAFRMVLSFKPSVHAAPGKTSEHEDVVDGRFVELVPGRRIVQAVEFDSGDPAFAGTMTMTWTLVPVPGGTEVTILCEDVPPGIGAEDHLAGLNSTLDNLAAFVG